MCRSLGHSGLGHSGQLQILYILIKRPFESLKNIVHTFSSCHVPTSVHEALADPKWTKVIKEEMDALLKNGTWTLVPLLEGKKLVGVQMNVFYKTHNRWMN
jgi:hypothetical protein